MHLLLTGLCCTSSMTPLSLHNYINKNTQLSHLIFQVEFLQIVCEITKICNFFIKNLDQLNLTDPDYQFKSGVISEFELNDSVILEQYYQ